MRVSWKPRNRDRSRLRTPAYGLTIGDRRQYLINSMANVRRARCAGDVHKRRSQRGLAELLPQGFTDCITQQNGQPTILGNSVIERINVGVPIKQSSCITCHAYASFDKTGLANSAAANANLTGKVGRSKQATGIRDQRLSLGDPRRTVRYRYYYEKF
jgi:hypothetical protein